MKECKRKICVWYDEKLENNCLNTSKVCTQPQTEDERCPAFEIDNVKHNI
ncbi:MAG: hypothetical protein KAJ44_06545 [Thermoplasmatales archaeon]|nr:hypothetical protein [Thermoplasmatales archaeon]